MFRLFIFMFIALSPSMLWADGEIKCNNGGNQQELNACARDRFEKADKELNQVYNALIKKENNNSLFVEKLKSAQRAWIVFRDAELEARFACPEDNIRYCWGSMYPMLYLDRKAELTIERTKHLQQILEVGVGQ